MEIFSIENDIRKIIEQKKSAEKAVSEIPDDDRSLISFYISETDASARYFLIKRLSEKENEKYKNIFMKGLCDSEASVRLASRNGLIRLGKNIIPFLISALEDHLQTEEYSIILALSGIGDLTALKQVMKIIEKKARMQDVLICRSFQNYILRLGDSGFDFIKRYYFENYKNVIDEIVETGPGMDMYIKNLHYLLWIAPKRHFFLQSHNTKAFELYPLNICKNDILIKLLHNLIDDIKDKIKKYPDMEPYIERINEGKEPWPEGIDEDIFLSFKDNIADYLLTSVFTGDWQLVKKASSAAAMLMKNNIRKGLSNDYKMYLVLIVSGADGLRHINELKKDSAGLERKFLILIDLFYKKRADELAKKLLNKSGDEMFILFLISILNNKSSILSLRIFREKYIRDNAELSAFSGKLIGKLESNERNN